MCMGPGLLVAKLTCMCIKPNESAFRRATAAKGSPVGVLLEPLQPPRQVTTAVTCSASAWFVRHTFTHCQGHPF